MLTRVLSSCGQLFGWGPKEDRRIHTRSFCAVETSIQPVGTPPAYSSETDPEGSSHPKELLRAQVVNVSRGGIRLKVNRFFAEGELLSVNFPGANEERQEVSTALACVVHTQRLGEGEWALGCSFMMDLTSEELDAFQPQEGRIPSEKRSYERYPCRTHALLQPMLTPDATPNRAEVQDISANGVAFVVEQPLNVGQLLNAEFQDEHNQVVLSCLISIVRTTPLAGKEGSETPFSAGNGKQLVGCNFIEELSEHQLKLLI